ncbi:hypothetical protein Syun_014259 [Stephania yunnanensis]|uniref:Uncharacterized protein n=1 Tax=Stephania yunnanensis TaxID=152371 RepID=A0AAP0JJE4_9MAGN
MAFFMVSNGPNKTILSKLHQNTISLMSKEFQVNPNFLNYFFDVFLNHENETMLVDCFANSNLNSIK